MTTIWYYVLPMLLGRTYDMKTSSPGVDIFPEEVIRNATVIRRHFTDSQYRMVSDTQEARDFLGVSGELSLKIKTGNVQIEGLGQYMKETYSRSKVVEILVKVHYETETYTLPSTAKPRVGWQTLDQRDIGTHYVRSITYGGDLVASLRFTAKNAADREKIRAVVQANLQADSGSFGLGIEGNFSRLQEDLKDSSTLEINYYATVPIKSVANTMESLIELVEDFPAQTQLVNNGIGVPLSMELFPLSALDSDVQRYLETTNQFKHLSEAKVKEGVFIGPQIKVVFRDEEFEKKLLEAENAAWLAFKSVALIDQLDLLESQFDDLLATKKSFQEWLLNIPPVLPQELEDEMGNFNDELEKISLVFYKVLGNMNLKEDATVDQFQDAFKAYEGDGGNLPDKYFRKYLVLRHKVLQGSQPLSMDVGGATFTHWGQDVCATDGAQILYKGILVSTDRVKGGTADVICLSNDFQEDEDMDKFQRHHRYYSKLSPVYMNGRNISSDKPIECGKCFVEERTAPTTFTGRTSCPPQWTLEYQGYIMTKDIRSRKGDYICMDVDSRESESDLFVLTKTDKQDFISDVKLSCGTLPCDKYEKDKLLPCVVCTY